MRKDDDVEIPSLTLDQDELNDRTSTSATAQKAGKQRLNPPPAKPSVAKHAPSKKPSLGFVYFLLLLIIGGAGAGGYWLWLENTLFYKPRFAATTRDKVSHLAIFWLVVLQVVLVPCDINVHVMAF